MQLNDVRAIVTGGASGLGLAATRHLAGKGAKLALFDLCLKMDDKARPTSSAPRNANTARPAAPDTRAARRATTHGASHPSKGSVSSPHAFENEGS